MERESAVGKSLKTPALRSARREAIAHIRCRKAPAPMVRDHVRRHRDIGALGQKRHKRPKPLAFS